MDFLNTLKPKNVKNDIETFYKLINNKGMKILYSLSEIHNSIVMESTRLPIKKGEYIVVKSGFNNIYAILCNIGSNHKANDRNFINYFLVTNCKNSHKNSDSIFNYRVGQSDFYMSNLFTDKLSVVQFKSELFFNLLTSLIHLIKEDKNSEDLSLIRSRFYLLYSLLFRHSACVKKLLSIHKYLNVLSFSSYGNIENIFDKYFLKEQVININQLCYIHLTITNTNENITKSLKISETDGIKNLKGITLSSFYGEVNDITTMIKNNTYYNIVYKDTTPDFVNYKKFVNTIISNNENTCRKPLNLKRLVDPESKLSDEEVYEKLKSIEANYECSHYESSKRYCYFDSKILRNSTLILTNKIKNLYKDHKERFSRTKIIDYISIY
jgi:hypothetical protein